MAQRKPKLAESVWDLPRNDVRACVAFYQRQGTVSGEELSVMLRLQDDPDELLALARRWKTSGAPGM